MILDLFRVGQSRRGTFGVLCHQEVAFVLTLERPWEDNQENVSCIPAGRYQCRRIHSPRFGDTYQICDVPGRTHVLFHWGNRLKDTQGCVLLGEQFSGSWSDPFLAHSRDGFVEFMDCLGGLREFDLQIYDRPSLRRESVEV